MEQIQLQLDVTAPNNNIIVIPQRKIPKNFSINKEEFFLGGYFLGYECSYSSSELVDIFKNKQFPLLTGKSTDFFIVFIDKLSNDILVLTGQSGRFPCYFAIEDNKAFLSTDFVWVAKKQAKKLLDLDFIFHHIYKNNGNLLTEKTLYQEVKQIPPSTLLTIKHDGSYSLTPTIVVDEYLPQEERFSFSEFSSRLITLLGNLIEERLDVIGGIPITCELTSGFDSSLIASILAKKMDDLVAFSTTSRFSPDDSNREVTKLFAKKHNISLKLIDVDNFFPFCSEETDIFTKQHFYPANHSLETALAKRKHIGEFGYNIIFDGHGGDELYKGNSIEWFRFPLQMDYFLFISSLKIGIDKLFTEKGLELFLLRERFSNRSLFANGIATSALNIGLFEFPIYWETNTWGISLLSDPRVVKLARHAPEITSKKTLWKERKDIFIPEQFSQRKGDFGKHVAQFLTNQRVREKVIHILENSFLTQAGVIRGSEIIDSLKVGKEDVYTGTLLPVLLNILRIENFLQSV